MKKRTSKALAMGTALMFVSSVAMAANVTDITQVGDENISTATQSGVDNNLVSNQNTFGDNSLTATSYGTDNVIWLDQDLNSAAGGDNTATINQETSAVSGNTNVARIDQESTGAVGGANTATVTQKGGTNKLVSADSMDGAIDAGTAGTAFDTNATQSTTGTSTNLLVVNQLGGNNQAGMQQLGTLNNDANINQINGGNRSGSYQKAIAGSNDLDLDQTAAAGASVSKLFQNSTISGNNGATITQSSLTASSTVFQSGTGANTTTVTQN